MGNEVQRVRTEASDTQMAQAILEAWEDLFKNVPSKEQVSLVLAQNALETGRQRKSMWNNNVGNIKADLKGPYDYFYLRGPEQTSPGKWEQLRMAFRAYKTLKEGVKDYLTLLSKSSRYAGAWQHILHPDPVAFSKALKAGGYYTANEDAYTKGLTGLYSQFAKSKSYEAAQSGKVEPPKGSTMPDEKDSWLQKFLAKHNGTDPFKQLVDSTSPSHTAPASSNTQDNSLFSTVNKYLQQIVASEKSNKKLYKRFLPSNNVTISIQANYTDAIEFSRILCTALNEELMADSYTHTDGENVEVQCTIPGPSKDCFNAVSQLTQAIAETFKKATVKVGGIDVKTEFFMNKRSSYQQISINTATAQYRKFLLKFI